MKHYAIVVGQEEMVVGVGASPEGAWEDARREARTTRLDLENARCVDFDVDRFLPRLAGNRVTLTRR